MSVDTSVSVQLATLGIYVKILVNPAMRVRNCKEIVLQDYNMHRFLKYKSLLQNKTHRGFHTA